MQKNVVNTIKMLGIDMISNASSGHPGIVLSSAPILYTLYSKYLNINVNQPNWPNRDRFVMSAGHGSALLYATLYMAGYNYTIDDLKQFRKIGSKCPGHPELNPNLGIEMTTGPLGQGISSAVGMAIASKKLNQKYMLPKKSKLGKERSLFNYNVYALVGDGDLMEGVSYEAISLAGSLKLNNLIVLYDSNDISLDGKTQNVFDEDICKRFEAMGWDTILVKDGSAITSIDKALGKAQSSDKPVLIQIKTIIGKDSINEGTNLVHGSPLAREDVDKLRQKYEMTNQFEVKDEVKAYFQNEIKNHANKKYDEWRENYMEYLNTNFAGDSEKMKEHFENNIALDLSEITFNSDLKESTRLTNSTVMNIISSKLDNFIGGSADLSSSTKTYLEKSKDITYNDYSFSNIKFGVREHAMGAILNGLALSNYNVFGSTFLVFSDYLKPAIRLTCLMDLPVTYIFTHDSINIGPDGATHQPIEQINMLRGIPNLNVFRPCDGHEIVGCWEYIINSKKPACLILGRNDVNLLETTNKDMTKKGAYIVRKEKNTIHGIIISTGSEVQTSVNIANELYNQYKLDLRVISMPNRELYLKQDDNYKNEIIPKGYRNIVIEAGNSYGWESFVYNSKYLITLNNFGISGTKDEVLNHMNFNYENIKERIIKLFK